MQLSSKTKKKIQHEKELKSFRNKMGSNIVWFDSLSKTRKFDLLFNWKKIKRSNKRVLPEFVKVSKKVPIDPTRPWGRKKVVSVIEKKFPPSLKHFIKSCRSNPSYQPIIQKVRQTAIDIILNEK